MVIVLRGIEERRRFSEACSVVYRLFTGLDLRLHGGLAETEIVDLRRPNFPEATVSCALFSTNIVCHWRARMAGCPDLVLFSPSLLHYMGLFFLPQCPTPIGHPKEGKAGRGKLSCRERGGCWLL